MRVSIPELALEAHTGPSTRDKHSYGGHHPSVDAEVISGAFSPSVAEKSFISLTHIIKGHPSVVYGYGLPCEAEHVG